MQALQYIRSVPRWLLVRALGGTFRGLATGPFSCLRLTEVAEPALPAPDWVKVRPKLCGICGSDLSTVACKGSPYFSPFVSTPFVPGHELVGTIAETGPKVPPEWPAGRRVVIEPALGCAVRGLDPPCGPCAAGFYAHCTRILEGTIAGGIQTGYCRSTGGGWSSAVVVHHSQLHAVPDGLDDEEAVLAEPFACALHAALKCPRGKDATLLVLGCGTIGLLTIAGYRAAGGQARILASARFGVQAELAKQFGADEVFTGGMDSKALYRWVLDRCGGSYHQPELGKPVLLGGVPVVLDCVGSSQTIDDALRLAAPQGTVILVGMPGIPEGVDLTSLWYKELKLHGAYAYGWEERDGQRVRTLGLALKILAEQHAGGAPLKALANRKYPLTQYRKALDDAFHSGESGAFKVVFEIGAGK